MIATTRSDCSIYVQVPEAAGSDQGGRDRVCEELHQSVWLPCLWFDQGDPFNINFRILEKVFFDFTMNFDYGVFRYLDVAEQDIVDFYADFTIVVAEQILVA